jgi:hypothetical protein
MLRNLDQPILMLAIGHMDQPRLFAVSLKQRRAQGRECSSHNI